jgi:hypothetical protein
LPQGWVKASILSGIAKRSLAKRQLLRAKCRW